MAANVSTSWSPGHTIIRAAPPSPSLGSRWVLRRCHPSGCGGPDLPAFVHLSSHHQASRLSDAPLSRVHSCVAAPSSPSFCLGPWGYETPGQEGSQAKCPSVGRLARRSHPGGAVQQRLHWPPRPRGCVLLGCDAPVARGAWLVDQEREAFLYRLVPGALI